MEVHTRVINDEEKVPEDKYITSLCQNIGMVGILFNQTWQLGLQDKPLFPLRFKKAILDKY